MIEDDFAIWAVIFSLGLGTYAMRFAFLGLLGSKTYPDWALRLLRYAPQAVLPGILVPMMLPQDGAPPDMLRIGVAALAFLFGLYTRHTLKTLVFGGAVYFGAKALGLA